MDVILKYFKELTPRQIEQFEMLEPLYNEWNSKINVVSRKDIDALYMRHVLHSLAIAHVIHFKPGTRILDVGCGGGFPGIPLAILFPGVQFTLIDSIGKKIKVVNEVAKTLGLSNVEGIQKRAEKLDNRYHFIVSRAVAAFPKFVALTRKLIEKKQFNDLNNGIIYLKGGEFSDETALYSSRIKIYNIPDFFEEEFFETKKIIYLPL
ncbi:MAG: 16S rRNA (guanine(527)-N(7))-methyltransferase RsmG [Prolixibacteraceae bacterium]|nr:16S rRNA (guanine(527)-N(7))-methyltransferase RsmG [Prolixibacteraceae bacterium]